MTKQRTADLVNAILRAFGRIEDALKDPSSDMQETLRLPTYQESIERAILLSPDLLDKLFRILLDLSHALQHVYIDATYRSHFHFNASLDLSEISAYSNPSPSRAWSEIVRFSITHRDKEVTKYNVLPTTVLETLSFLRRFYRSCQHYGNYSSLQRLLADPVIDSSAGLDDLDELSLPMIEQFGDALPFATFLRMIQSSGAEANPHDPVRALLDLITEGRVESIDGEMREVFADRAVRMKRYDSQYATVLAQLQWRRPDRHFNNSIDARSYQLSLALNELVHDQNVYFPILSSGVPLNEFANIGWDKDPLRSEAKLETDKSIDLEDLKERRIFTTARGPHYHYISTLLQLKHAGDRAAIADSARISLVKVKEAIDDWSRTLRRLDYRGTKPSMARGLRMSLLRIDRGVISDNTKQLLAIERSARSRISDPDEFRERLRDGGNWLTTRYPNRDAYDSVIKKNFEIIRNQVIRTFDLIGDPLRILIDAEKSGEGPILPDLHDLVVWTARMIEGKEE